MEYENVEIIDHVAEALKRILNPSRNLERWISLLSI